MRFNNIIKKIKQYEKEGMEISLIVKNIVTKEEGVASLTTDNKIAVFEGNDDGRDDKIYSLEDFKNSYKVIRLENEYEEELQ